MGERWGCLVIDRASRFVVAHASGPHDGALAERAVRQTQVRSAGQAVAWCSDGWRTSPAVIEHASRQPVPTGRRGRPALRLPAGGALTQTIKHRDRHGHLGRSETRVPFGAPVAQPALVHVERRHGVCRDRLNALTRQTHAFAKTAPTWDALLGLHVFGQHWLRPHPALRVAGTAPERVYDQRMPAMALGPTDHAWTWRESLTTPPSISSSGGYYQFISLRIPWETIRPIFARMRSASTTSAAWPDGARERACAIGPWTW